MSTSKAILRRSLTQNLDNFIALNGLPSGIASQDKKDCFIEQLIESKRRIDFVETIKSRPIASSRLNPTNSAFDPIRGATLLLQRGEIEEAAWLIFLSVHFGKPLISEWKLIAAFYGELGHQWNWNAVRHSSASQIDNWVQRHYAALRANKMKFGNHRKYESLREVGMVFESYVSWIVQNIDHQTLFSDHLIAANNDPKKAFASLYSSMKKVKQFGRTARFDYLTMIGKIGIAKIQPDKAYLIGSSGPKAGAILFFGNNFPTSILEIKLADLAKSLNLGMQEMEDSLCNWQKSPSNFIRFRG